MPYQQSDLDKLDAAILTGVKKVTFADGRGTEFHSLDEMRRLRSDVKAELAASASQTSRRTRLTIARVGRCR
ncbi:phage head-tail joining protein [Sphingomonas sp.]|uniref:phage head-tail joining protein n=1 Tax=Sphingomonas sp. TaxID=28214 RepID=UPI003AFF7E24